MSTRRAPLSSNPNAANSPLRGAAAALAAKQRRSHADLQREEAYGQPPPAKRQMLDALGARPARSPSQPKPVSARPAVQRTTAKGYAAAEKTAAARNPAARVPDPELIESLKTWQATLRVRLPKMVFYFESVPDDQRGRLTKQVTHLGAREEKFFSIDITHVVTTRSIPPEKAASQQDVADADANTENQPPSEQQPRTIDPSLLNRLTEISASSASTRRKLLFETSNNRRLPMQTPGDDATRRLKGRNTDILHRAREMGKKIWSLEKLQRIVEILMEPDPYKAAVLAQEPRGTAESQESASARATQDSHLLQLLQNERVHGPSDRDLTVASKELVYFRGPYLYVYDIEEKQKPIMVREYAKVADKKDGDWPQFRTAANGRCPFVEDGELAAKKQKPEPERVAKAAVPAAPVLNPPPPPPPQTSRSVTGKRTLAEMEDGNNRGSALSVRGRADAVDAAKVASNPPSLDGRVQQNAFTSRARAGRLFAGEPVASGVQPSNVTSAVRSAMISSTTGGLAVKAGTSKEIHRLQRKVLQRNSVPLTSQASSSRRLATGEPTTGYESTVSFVRSNSISRAASVKLDVVGEEEGSSARPTDKHRRTASATSALARQSKPKKKDPKPGYCENCQDKFDDFDDHVVSSKHRKFAYNDANWLELDSLLGKLKRAPRYQDELTGASLFETDDDSDSIANHQ